MNRQYFVYIMTNSSNHVLYTGVTNNLNTRVWQHREGLGSRFTERYNVKKLVYYEIAEAPGSAITREKQLKAGSRQKKIELINAFNPSWTDLYEQI